jgi:hypothetical protein
MKGKNIDVFLSNVSPIIIRFFGIQKIEIIDEDEEDVIEMMPSDMEQMQNLLEFKVNEKILKCSPF